MKSLAAKVWVSILVVLSCAYGRAPAAAAQRSDVRGPRRDAPADVPLDFPVADFTLTERQRAGVPLFRAPGKPWVASFFFSSCPGPCRQVNMQIAELQRDLAEQDVRFVSITVDPTTDTPEVLKRYSQEFAADPERWLFLTGPLEAIRQVAEGSFKVAFSRVTHARG